MATRQCVICKTVVKCPPSKANRKTCGMKCAPALSSLNQKDGGYTYRGGCEKLDPSGYWKKYDRTRKKFVSLHRWIMEQYIGRQLHRQEIVHHLNGDKNDNRIENLGLTSVKGHAKEHLVDMWSGREKNGFYRSCFKRVHSRSCS